MSAPSEEVSVIDMEDGITLAQAVVDTVRDPLLVLDHALRVIAVGRSFCQTFRLSSEDVRGHLLYEIDGGQWDIPELRELLETISAGQAVIEDYEVEREFPTIGHRIIRLSARKVFYETGSHSTVLLAFEDVTFQRAFEQQVQGLLREKDMLLQEIEHRVANSLQILASILILKARAVQSEEARRQLEDAHKRVMSVAAVQKHLHVSGGSERLADQGWKELAIRLSSVAEALRIRFEAQFWDEEMTTYVLALDGRKRPCRGACNQCGPCAVHGDSLAGEGTARGLPPHGPGWFQRLGHPNACPRRTAV